MGNTVKERLSELTETDVYSMILFALYKISDNPKYTTLSELTYVLDRKNLIRFLECFGGLTIKVPTVEELTIMTDALLLYELTHLEDYTLEDALKEIDTEGISLKSLKVAYVSICDILSKYDKS